MRFLLNFLLALYDKMFMPLWFAGTFNSVTDRTDSGALIPEEVTSEIFQNLPQQSSFLQLARRLPDMSRKQLRMPILSVLPTGYFVNGDTGFKQTTDQAWANKYINAEAIAVIVPIPEDVINDVDYDMWKEIQPRLVEAFGKVIDLAVFHGTNKPATWPTAIVPGALATGNSVALGTGVDMYDDLLGENGVISAVEADGYMVNAHVAAMSMRGKLRGLRDADGHPIFTTNMQQAGSYLLDGNGILFPRNGGIDPTSALLISGDFSQAVYSIRQEISWKVLSEAVITDDTGAVVYNLPQQDMVALRAVMRLGWEIPNPVNSLQANAATRYPFGVLTP